jgi:short-subunit dehydrogenase involved in D-alanine esterification of teichoic acids
MIEIAGTGGTKGIGAAIARRFELSGGSVTTTARSELPVNSSTETANG